MARRSKGSGSCFCGRGVQRFKSGFELLGSTGLKILEKLGAGSIASEVARDLGCCKSNVTYWKNKLLDMGALRLQAVDVVKYYQLTPYGSKILARSEGCGLEPVVLEDYAVKFVVVEPERVRIDWEKLGSPRNWLQLGVRIGGVKVERTSRHVIIHPGRLKGFDVDELEVEAGRIVERVKMVLENRFGMVLSDEGVPLHKPIYRFYSEEAKEDVKNGTCIVEGVGSVDNSPPENVPHEEYKGKDRAKARLLLPDQILRLERKVDMLTENVCKLVDSVSKLSETLGQLAGAEPTVPNKFEKPYYVR
ncbi:MAG: hypothetical protein QXX51_08515 [Candidatus Bathyarchaeia archaeon]